MEAAKANRHGHWDSIMVLMAYRHGLRASELCDLRWDQVDFNQAALHVRRVKQGTPATHPLTGLEMRALRLVGPIETHCSWNRLNPISPAKTP
jgi:integrase